MDGDAGIEELGVNEGVIEMEGSMKIK